MVRVVFLGIFMPWIAIASIKAYSPTNIQPNDLSTNDFIDITDGTNLFGDLGFKEQKNIVDEILGALGDLNITGNLVKKEFDLDGRDAVARIKANLNLDRRVYSTNLGEVDQNGEPLSPLRSVYTVVDEVRHELRFETEFDINSVLAIEPIELHAGIAVRRVYEVDNLADYLDRRKPKESLKEIGVTATERDTSSNFLKKSDYILKAFNAVINATEEIFRTGSDFFADEERSKIFLHNLFDPLRLDAEFFSLTAQKIRDSKNIQVGEILIHSINIQVSPFNLKLEKSNFETRYLPRAYTYIIHSAFKKVSKTEVIAKSILEIRKGREIRARIELANTGFDPLRWDYTSTNYFMNEYGYKFDLSKQEHLDAFNDIFSRRWFTRDIKKLPKVIGNFASLQNPTYLQWTKDHKTADNAIDNRFKLELLAASYKSQSVRRVESIVTKQVDGGEVTEYIGNTGKVSSSRVRIGPKSIKKDRDGKKLLKSYIRLNPSNDKIQNSELAFEYSFSDHYSSYSEFENDVAFLKMAIAADSLRESKAIKEIVAALDQRLQNKKHRDDPQYLALRLSLSSEMSNKIFSNKDNIENIKYFIGKLFLNDRYKNWEDISQIQLNPETNISVVTGQKSNLGPFTTDCTSLVYKEHNLVFGAAEKVSCFKLNKLANNIFNTFVRVANAPSSLERLSILNTFLKQRQYRAYVPLLILQLAMVDKIENNVAQFNSIDSLIASKDIGIELVVDGAGMDFPLRLDFDHTDILRRFRLAEDFDFLDMANGARRIQVKGAYMKANERSMANPSVYVRFNSNVKFDKSHRLIGSINEYKFIRADEPIAKIHLDGLDPIFMQDRHFSDVSNYAYVIAIPQGQALQLQKRKDYIFSFHIVDANGKFASEISEVKFTVR